MTQLKPSTHFSYRAHLDCSFVTLPVRDPTIPTMSKYLMTEVRKKNFLTGENTDQILAVGMSPFHSSGLVERDRKRESRKRQK